MTLVTAILIAIGLTALILSLFIFIVSGRMPGVVQCKCGHDADKHGITMCFHSRCRCNRGGHAVKKAYFFNHYVWGRD